MVNRNRILTWDGCINTRDLGGLQTAGGRVTRWGALVRGDDPARLTAAGWSALYEHGIRTIVSLHTHGQVEEMHDNAPRPADLTSLEVEIEDLTDAEFVQRWVVTDLWCTPIYYRDALERWPQRHAAAIAAVARARPGGVLVHCRRGNDRTGIMALLLLAIAGVAPDEIVADYELSPDPDRDALLAREHTCTRDVLLATLAWLNVDSYLRAGGLSQEDLDTLRARLLAAPGNEENGENHGD